MKNNRISVLHIDKNLLLHLGIRAYEEYWNYMTSVQPRPLPIATWKQLPDAYKQAWIACAATVITEANNVLTYGIKEADRR